MAIEDVLKQIRKTYGKESIMLYDSGAILDVPAISTGSLGLDIASGIGGVPQGRQIEIFGKESSGKTTLGLHIVREAQVIGMRCAFLDMEQALDMKYAKDIGVNVDELLVSQPEYGEMAFDIAEQLILSKEIGVIVVDSVTALVTKKEIEGSINDNNIAPQARLMSKALRKLNPICKANNVIILYINQVRTKIGLMFGDPTITTGGDALKFYSSMRLQTFGKKEKVTKGEEIERINCRVYVAKNKVAPPYKEAIFDILFGYGIDEAAEIFEYGIKNGIVQKSKSIFSVNKKQIGITKDESIEFLSRHPKAMRYIRLNVLKALKESQGNA